jgi:2-polyprenyl-3-methyl-5-hydroxy-6-metoxy-1,4-benzoquinol methylase
VASDPVDAYDRIAPEFARLSEQRRAYLNRVERLVIDAIPEGARSLLDIGSGDGTRAFRIAAARRLPDVILLEPSAAMRAMWPHGACGWPIRAEELGEKVGQFDVITCLWNVLGHIFPDQQRAEVLRHCARLLSPNGRLFVDVSHRYNARHYGVMPTLARMLRDGIAPNGMNGDVQVHWTVNATTHAAQGHVFTDAEFRRIATGGGLRIENVFAVDYSSGKVRRSLFQGHLFYIASRSTEQTSSISAPVS